MSEPKPKKILHVRFSQTGQLDNLCNSVCSPLKNSANIEFTEVILTPIKPYPFPWPFISFFNHFPETVYDEPQPIDLTPLEQLDDNYDLIILGYQVWFLSPSQPTTAFLQSSVAKELLNGTPVITIIGCRNMWLMAQEHIKLQLEKLNAKLIDNIVLTDDAHSAATFISTPLWMLTGNKGPFLNGLIPQAGIPQTHIKAASRFGDAIVEATELPQTFGTQSMMQGLNAVQINETLIASETIGKRSFRIWGKLLRALGKPEAPQRKVAIVVYVLFLVTLILTVVPISALIKRLLKPLTRKKIAEQKRYFAQPSGE